MLDWGPWQPTVVSSYLTMMTPVFDLCSGGRTGDSSAARILLLSVASLNEDCVIIIRAVKKSQ